MWGGQAEGIGLCDRSLFSLCYDCLVKRLSRFKYLVGIDEAGRGPLAGPVAVGAVMIKAEDYAQIKRLFVGAGDSKQLSPERRDYWFRQLLAAKQSGSLNFCVSFSGPTVIDCLGIVPAIARALARSLRRLLPPPTESLILLDGSLRAPGPFTNQQTIIRGDESELLIGLASIAAKVSRDRLMIRADRRWPGYGFVDHKGYGSQSHYAAISRLGLCPLHRRSFLKNIAK